MSRLFAVLATAASVSATVCLPGGVNSNNQPGIFQSTGTLVALRVGDGITPFVTGNANALYLDEIQISTGNVLQTLALPTGSIPTPGTDNNVGNLACTLSTGMYSNKFWDYSESGMKANYCKTPLMQGSAPYPSTSASGVNTFGTLNINSAGATQTCTSQQAATGPGAKTAAGIAAGATAYQPGGGWPGYNASFGPNGDGSYPLWYFDREGMLGLSYDGRFVSLPCYVTQAATPTTPGAAFKLGSVFFGQPPAWGNDGNTYDDKTIALIAWNGLIDTTTWLPGSQFYYGSIIPDEPQYVTSAITTGELWPYVSYYSGNSGDNGEGTMLIPFDSLTDTKTNARVSHYPGYYDYGVLGFQSNSGNNPTQNSTGDAPLIFVGSPSILNAGAASTQNQNQRGLNYGTYSATSNGVGQIVEILPPNVVINGNYVLQFDPLQGMLNFTGAPFGFFFDSNSSLWMADAGVVSVWDKYSCSIQHWVGTPGVGIVQNYWNYSSTIVVDANVPCYSMFGRWEGSPSPRLYLYLSTSTANSSTIYRVDAFAGTVSVVKTAAPNVVYRSVQIPPQPRANYSCPVGQYGTTYDLACSYNCCAPCTTSCAPGYYLVPTCSYDSDNLCLTLSAYQALGANVMRRRLEADGSEAEAPSAVPAMVEDGASVSGSGVTGGSGDSGGA